MKQSLQSWLGLVASASLAALAPQTVLSQSQPANPDEPKEEAKDEGQATAAAAEAPPAEVAEIVVTGSRIRRTEFDAAAPVTIITSERSTLAGLVSTEEILRASTIASGEQINDSFQGFITDGGPGANTISLRGLGSQRTLVLVNGRRWSPSGVQGSTNSVDLSAIPSSLVQRVEILKDGASSIYGADAVAGVVNLITKEAFNGFQVNYSGFITEESDGTTNTIDLSWGRVGERGSVSFGAQYSERDPIYAADRDWASCPIDPRITDQDGDGTLDNRSPITNEPLCFGFLYGALLTNVASDFLRFEPSLANRDPANPFFDPRVNGVFGISGYTRLPVRGLDPRAPRPGTGDTPRPNPLWDNDGSFYRDELSPSVQMISTGSKLLSLTSFGTLDVDAFGGQSELYYEAYWNSRTTRSSFGYRQFFPFVEPVTFDGRALHPYNPLALPLFRLNPAFLGAAGFQPVIPSYGIQNPESEIEVDRYNIFAGAKGDIGARWEYDFTLGYGYSKGYYRSSQWLDDRVEAAVNGIVINPTTGAVTCAPEVLAQFPGCVPANLVTADALLRGILPQNVVDFISKDTEGSTVYKGKQVSAYVNGPVFNLPAGEVQAVFGAEWREESIDDVPDIEAQNNNFWGFSTAGITRGTDTVKEFFTEVELPLLRDLPLVKDLSVNLSGRWTDYDSYGDDTTYRGTLRWVMTPTVSLRASIGSSFRAPDLYEQFLADQVGFVSNLNDPCSQFGAFYDPGDTIYDNCLSLGLDPDTYVARSSITSITAGAAGLEAETSDAHTFGLIFKPENLNVSIAVDYFRIKVENSIASPSAAFILFDCYDSPNFSSSFCSRVGPRSPRDGQVTFVDATFLNVAGQESKGVDINVVYDQDLEIGRLTFDWQTTYLIKQNFILFGDVIDDVTELAGRWGYPRWSSEAQVRFNWRDFTFAWSTSFIGKSDEEPVFDPGTTNIDRINKSPNHFEHGLSVRYTGADWEVIGTVRNIFDENPPFLSGGQGAAGASRFLNTTPGVGYDLFGRSYVLRVSKKFD